MACLICQAEDRPVIWHPPEDMPCTLRDIVSRLPKNSPAYEPDWVTWGHEGSHFLSKHKEGWHGLYMLEGNIRYVPSPPLLTEQVFRNIPVAKRGTIYETYRQQGNSEYWQTRPLMLLDEWTAYLRGSTIRRELGWTKRVETDRHCATMAGYCEVMWEMSTRCEGYDHAALRAFCLDMLDDCRRVIPEWDRLSDARFEWTPGMRTLR